MERTNVFGKAGLRLLAALITLACLAALLPSLTVSAEGDAPPVSAGDVSGGDVAPDAPQIADEADFTRVVEVPANVEIPSFYQAVTNVSGMYIFTLPDGRIFKRIYGAIDGRYGWYEPVGTQNIIYADAQPIDIAADKALYTGALDEAELSNMERQEFGGLIPPEDGVTQVEQVRGISVELLSAWCSVGAAGICLLISFGARIRHSVRRSRKRREGSR